MPEPKRSPFIQIVSDLINALVTVIEEKDVFFRGHSERVAVHGLNLARRLDLPKGVCDTIYLAGQLHDIGMVYIPSEIIHKTDELIESELVLLRQHPILAEKILSRISIFKNILPIIRHHHENFDGSGYPDGLQADQIPLGARVLHLADTFDILTSALPGKPALGMEEALNTIQANQGPQFDPKLVIPFINMIRSTYASGPKPPDDEDVVKQAVRLISEKFERGENGLPVLPGIVLKIRETIAAPDYAVDSLAKLLELDAVISVRLITVANSVVYRGHEKVLTVRQAVPRLGTKETENIVMAIVNRSLYQTDEKELQSIMERLWMHALATAFCAKLIAARLKLPEQDNYFTMGLIHDIGKVPLLQAISRLRTTGDEFMHKLSISSIINILQEAHESLGAGLLKKWEFADDFVRVALMHATTTLNEQTEPSILVIQAANIMTRKMGYNSLTDEELDLGSLQSAQLLGIEAEALNEICQVATQIVQSSANMF